VLENAIDSNGNVQSNFQTKALQQQQ
jgi:hypothetical protein